MDLNIDPYKVLGSDPNATEREIKRRYRLLSKKSHPDVNPNDPKTEERFKLIQWAYESVTNGGKLRRPEKWTHMEPSAADCSADATHPFTGFFEALRAYGSETSRKRSAR